MNIYEHLIRPAQLFPDQEALVYAGSRLTYRCLAESATCAADELRERGIQPGERVALMLPNVPAFAVWYYGILKLGAVAVSVSTRLAPKEVQFILADCQARLLVTDSEGRQRLNARLEKPELMDEVQPDSSARENSEEKNSADENSAEENSEASSSGMAISVLAVTELGDPVGQQFQRSETAERMHAFVQADSADAAVILYTSGTTGFAKGATLSHGNVRSTVHAFNHLCHLEPRDRILLSVPLFHCYGQNALLNSGLNVGATIVLQRRFDLQESKQLIVEERVSKLFSVPTSFQLLHDYCQPSDLKSVGYCFSAAATLPIQLGRRWQEKFGMPIYEGYGLTETAPFASYNHRLKHVPGSIGTPVDNVEMKIIDLESGQTCPPGKLGEIAIRGPNVMLGYWNRPRATAEVMRDGWFCSGDIGRMDERGYFFIVDRVKDMISIGGMKVYPAEVERVLLDHPAVREAAVVGFPDEVFGEKPVAFIVFNDSMRHDVDQLQPELKAVCHSSLADFKVPKHFVFVDELPRNPAGKILKTELREMEVPSSGMSTDAGLLANEQADVSESVREESGLPEISHGDSSAWLPRAAQLHPATWQREIEVLIQEELSSILAAERVPGLNERFVELGLDSMALVDLRDRLQWHFGTELELPATLVFDYPRICDLALYLAESLRASKQVERGPTEQEAESVAVEESPPPPSSADSKHHAQQLEEQDIASLSEAEALDALLRELQD